MPLDRVQVADFPSAMAQAMAQARTQFAHIAQNAQPPTFENTIVELERSGQQLADVRALYDLWGRNFRDDAFNTVEEALEPLLAQFDAEQWQDQALWRRVDAVFRERAQRSVEQRAVTERLHRKFVLAGAGLTPQQRTRMQAIDSRLSELFITYNQNLAQGGAANAVVVRDEAMLEGLPAAFRESAAAAAKARGLEKAWVLALHYNAVQTLLAHARRRDLRQQVWAAARHKADSGPFNNHDALQEILSLRSERSALLGFATAAEFKLEDSMMQSSARAFAWLAELGVPVAAQARRDVADLQRAADSAQDRAHQPRFVVEPWDLRFYEERLRESVGGVDEAEVSSYLDPELLLSALRWVAGELFELRFEPVADAPVPTPDLRVWAVARSTGPTIAYLMIDAYAHEGKQPGAWAMTYRDQQRLTPARLPVVSISYNLPRPSGGQHGAISWGDAVGLFHEFGHALQALLSDVTYPSLSGLNVTVDSLECASQWFERYLSTPRVLERFTRHAQTGRPMPPALAARIEASRRLGEGVRTSEMLGAALLDLRLHSAAKGELDVAAINAKVRAELQAPAQVLPLSEPTQAGYLFGGDNYSGQFYSYLWSDELAAEATAAFEAGAGSYDRAVAERFRAHVLSRGGSADPTLAFGAFLGHPPQLQALLKKRGLVSPP